ncbi:MAG: YbaB/EbfC family nucleoid-associated protein [Propionibacteriaceae bacterium]|jgi:DNA-binding protein YbaB|nr:YbaB/EbfC family nucleoid-associated protein [Propionibacteriaceae bacterium]
MNDAAEIHEMVASRAKVAQEAQSKYAELLKWRRGLTAIGYSAGRRTAVVVNGDGHIVDVRTTGFDDPGQVGAQCTDALRDALRELNERMAEEAERIGMPPLIDDEAVLDAADGYMDKLFSFVDGD